MPIILSCEEDLYSSINISNSNIHPKVIVFWQNIYKQQFSHFFSPPLGMPIESEIMDQFWCLRCLNDRINLLYMIGSFTSGANVSLVAKNGTKKIIPLLSIKSSLVDRFQSLKCLNNRIEILYMIGSFTSGANVSLVAKNRTKKIIPLLSIKSSPVDKEASNQKVS